MTVTFTLVNTSEPSRPFFQEVVLPILVSKQTWRLLCYIYNKHFFQISYRRLVALGPYVVRAWTTVLHVVFVEVRLRRFKQDSVYLLSIWGVATLHSGAAWLLVSLCGSKKCRLIFDQANHEWKNGRPVRTAPLVLRQCLLISQMCNLIFNLLIAAFQTSTKPGYDHVLKNGNWYGIAHIYPSWWVDYLLLN